MLLVTNGRVVTRDDANPLLEDGAVLIDGEKVAAVGSRADLEAAHPEAELMRLNIHYFEYSAADIEYFSNF